MTLGGRRCASSPATRVTMPLPPLSDHEEWARHAQGDEWERSSIGDLIVSFDARDERTPRLLERRVLRRILELTDRAVRARIGGSPALRRAMYESIMDGFNVALVQPETKDGLALRYHFNGFIRYQILRYLSGLKKRSIVAFDGMLAEQAEASATRADLTYAIRELEMTIEHAIRSQPENLRSIVEMYVIGMEYVEIAEKLNERKRAGRAQANADNVRAAINRFKLKMKLLLGEGEA